MTWQETKAAIQLVGEEYVGAQMREAALIARAKEDAAAAGLVGAETEVA